MIFFIIFAMLVVASLCFLVCAFWANDPKMLAVSTCLMIAAALTAATGATSDERFWTLACLAGAFALIGMSHLVSFQQLEDKKEDEKEKDENKEKES